MGSLRRTRFPLFFRDDESLAGVHLGWRRTRRFRRRALVALLITMLAGGGVAGMGPRVRRWVQRAPSPGVSSVERPARLQAGPEQEVARTPSP